MPPNRVFFVKLIVFFDKLNPSPITPPRGPASPPGKNLSWAGRGFGAETRLFGQSLWEKQKRRVPAGPAGGHGQPQNALFFFFFFLVFHQKLCCARGKLPGPKSSFFSSISNPGADGPTSPPRGAASLTRPRVRKPQIRKIPPKKSCSTTS